MMTLFLICAAIIFVLCIPGVIGLLVYAAFWLAVIAGAIKLAGLS